MRPKWMELRRLKKKLPAICSALFLFTSHVAAEENLALAQNKGAAIAIRTNVAYGPNPQETMDLCFPAPARQATPVLLLIHGGGWSGGDKLGYLPLCKHYAVNGIAAVSINYRLLNIAAHSNQWPAQIVDAQLAVRWVRAHAQELNLDGTKICAYGDSAGGHLALLLGLLTHKWIGDRDDLYSSESSSVSCVVDNFGPTDLSNGSLPIIKTAKELVRAGNGNGADTLNDASPLFHVHPLAAPTLIVQGSDDELVPKSQSISLRDAMLRNGVQVRYLEYSGSHQYKGLSAEGMRRVTEAQSRFIFSMLGK